MLITLTNAIHFLQGSIFMISVTFHENSRRTRQFKSENGALKAVWKWLKATEDDNAYAVIIGPMYSEPRVIKGWQELPDRKSVV